MENLKYNWDLTQLIKNENDANKMFEELKTEKLKFLSFKGRLASREGLLEYYKLKEEYEKKETIFICYLYLRTSLNGKDEFARQLLAKYEIFSQELEPKLAFIWPEIAKNKNKDLIEYSKQKEFDIYNLELKDVVKNKKHILPERINSVLSKNPAFGTGSSAFDSFNDIDLKFDDVKTDEGKVKLTHASYYSLIKNKNQSVRKNAYNTMHKTYAEFNYTLANLYLSDVKETIFFSQLEKYKSTLERDCNADEISPKVLMTLIETVRENLPLFYRFENDKKKALKLKNYYYFDNNLELGKVDRKFTYEQSAEIVCEALAVMGEEYISVLKKSLTDGWIDVYEKPAKTSGGFNMGVYGAHPYILLNHTDDYSGVSTLAHELGHCMHSYYSDKTQPITKSGYSIMVAEVASIVNEVILTKHLLKKAESKQERLYYVHQILTNFYTTVFRQTMFSEFEHYVYTTIESKKPILAEDLNEKYEELQNVYFGREAKGTEYSKFEWSRIPHFYRPYYVYKYAIGFISACTIASKIISGEERFLEKYKNFLSAGASLPPVELLKMVGVDITKKQTMQEAFDLYKNLLDEFEELTKE